MDDTDAEPRAVAVGREGALWRYVMYPLRVALQLGGGGVALFGLLGVVAEPLGLSDDAVAVCWLCGAAVMLGAAVKRGYPLPPVSASQAARRIASLCVLGTVTVGAVSFVSLRLGIDPRRFDGALAFLVIGLALTAAGRYPRIFVEGPLVSADELARADDVIAVGCGGLLALSVLVTTRALDPVAEWIAVVADTALWTRVTLVVLAGALPLTTVAAFAFGRRGRSPLDRAASVIALPIVIGALLAFGDPLWRASQEAATTLLSQRAAALARGWRAAAAIEGLSLGLGCVLSLLMALGAALRARHHGVVHDGSQRRHLALIGGLSLTAALLPLLAGWRSAYEPFAVVSARLSCAAVAAVGVVAVHLGAAAVGGRMSKLQSRASGYVASAGIGGVLAVVLCASALSVSAAARDGVAASAPLWWPHHIETLREAQRVTFVSGCVFVLPIALSAVLALRDRGRAAASAASRHFGWGMMWVSLGVLVVTLTAPAMRDAVAGVWPEAAPPGFALAPAPAGGDGCVDLDRTSLVFIDGDGVQQGGRDVAAVSRLDGEPGCATVAAALEPHHRELTLAIAPDVSQARIGCLLAALAREGARAPICHLRLVGGVDGVPKCIDALLSGGDCTMLEDARFISLTPGRIDVDDATVGRVTRHDWPAAHDAVGPWMLEHGVSVAARDDTRFGDVLRLLFAIGPRGERQPRRAPHLALALTPRAETGAPMLPSVTTAATRARGLDQVLADALAGALRGRTEALAACHWTESGASVDVDYRLRLEADGHVGAVWSGVRVISPSAAHCAAQVLADVALDARDDPSLLAVEVSLRTTMPRVRIDESAGDDARAPATAFWARELSDGALDRCYHRTLTQVATLTGRLEVTLRNRGDEETPDGWHRGDRLDVRVELPWQDLADEVASELRICLSDVLGRTGWPPELAEAPEAHLTLWLELPPGFVQRNE